VTFRELSRSTVRVEAPLRRGDLRQGGFDLSPEAIFTVGHNFLSKFTGANPTSSSWTCTCHGWKDVKNSLTVSQL
jgi:hypothetical protein